VVGLVLLAHPLLSAQRTGAEKHAFGSGRHGCGVHDVVGEFDILQFEATEGRSAIDEDRKAEWPLQDQGVGMLRQDLGGQCSTARVAEDAIEGTFRVENVLQVMMGLEDRCWIERVVVSVERELRELCGVEGPVPLIIKSVVVIRMQHLQG